jgi:hypothetical protein
MVFSEDHRQILKVEYTLGHDTHDNPYHNAIIRSQLSQNLETLYPRIRDEIVTVFEETLDLQGNGELEFVVIAVRH